MLRECVSLRHQITSLFYYYYYFFFGCTVKAHMRANTQNLQQGEQETRGVGEGKKNIVEQRHEEICGRERNGMGYT